MSMQGIRASSSSIGRANSTSDWVSGARGSCFTPSCFSAAHCAAGEIVERHRQTLTMWHWEDQRHREEKQERAVLQHAVRTEAEEGRADAEEERDAVGDHDEHPRVAMIGRNPQP